MQIRTYKKLSLLLCICFVLISRFPCYTGTILHTDDFSRIIDNAKLDEAYFKTFLTDNRSDLFYRPLNHLSFGITYHFFGLNAVPYALFNLFLLLGCIWLLFHILIIVSHSTVWASLITFSWLLNVKPIHSVLSWAVGRTASMYTFFTLLAIYFALKARKSYRILWLSLSVFSVFCAMLTKESGVIAPILILLIIAIDILQKGHFTLKHLLFVGFIFIIGYIGYFSLRFASGAMLPSTAPSFYKLDISLNVIFRHFLADVERSVLFSGLLIIAFFLRKPQLIPRKKFNQKHLKWYYIVGGGLLLFSIITAPEITIRSKSNLYVFFPSMIIVGMMVTLLTYTRWWPRRRSELKNMLILMGIIGVIVTPIAWEHGKSVKKEAYIYNWSQILYTYLKETKPSEIILLYNPESIHLKQADFDYLSMGVHLLMKQPVTILVNPQEYDDKVLVFEIVPVSNSLEKGNIKLVKQRREETLENKKEG